MAQKSYSLNISDNSTLESINLSKLVSASYSIIISGNDLLTNLDISSLTTCTSLNISSNTLLQTISITSSLSCTNVSFNANGLTSSCVDNIFDMLDLAGYTDGTLDISGGTNAAPTVDLPSKTNLLGKNWSITDNTI